MKKIKTLLYSLCMVMLLYACSDDDSLSSSNTRIIALETNNQLFTVINLMNPDSSNQERTLSLLEAGLQKTMIKQDGFVSSSLHMSLDNSYIINYAQWESENHLQAAADLVNSGGAPNMGEAFSLSNPDYHPFILTAQYKSSGVSPIIDTEGELLTIINVLQPLEGVTQEELLSLLMKAIQEEVLIQEGFVSATLHQSMDNDYIINYAQWEDEAALNGMVERLEAGNAPKLGTVFSKSKPDFHPFRVIKSFFSE